MEYLFIVDIDVIILDINIRKGYAVIKSIYTQYIQKYNKF